MKSLEADQHFVYGHYSQPKQTCIDENVWAVDMINEACDLLLFCALVVRNGLIRVQMYTFVASLT